MKNYVTYKVELIEENAEKLDQINQILLGGSSDTEGSNDQEDKTKKRKRRTKAEIAADKKQKGEKQESKIGSGVSFDDDDLDDDLIEENFIEEKTKKVKKVTALEVMTAVKEFSRHEDHSKPEAKKILASFGLDTLGEVETLEQDDLQKLYTAVQV